ncbi:MAG: hypothetical protein AABY22_24140 [Nanoarchaeota archaeon]
MTELKQKSRKATHSLLIQHNKDISTLAKLLINGSSVLIDGRRCRLADDDISEEAKYLLKNLNG